eukprot:364255-Chlamydomonas_euryale.AAC.7
MHPRRWPAGGARRGRVAQRKGHRACGAVWGGGAPGQWRALRGGTGGRTAPRSSTAVSGARPVGATATTRIG